VKALQVNLEVGERAIPSPKVQNQGEDKSCHMDEGSLVKLQGQKKPKENKHDPQEMKDHHKITQDSIEHCGNSPKPRLYNDSQKYVPIGSPEETSALVGSTIVGPSEGSLR
jgi:hypothetical protein